MFEQFCPNAGDANALVVEPETDLTQNGHSRSFKVIYFGIIEEPLMGYIAQYNKFGLKCEGSEDSERKKQKSPFLNTPLSFDAPSPANPHEYPHKTYLGRK